MTEWNDPSKIETQFLNGIQEPYVSLEKKEDFLQVLNDGKYQLLKQYSRKVMERDSLAGVFKKYVSITIPNILLPMDISSLH